MAFYKNYSFATANNAGGDGWGPRKIMTSRYHLKHHQHTYHEYYKK